jgi:peptidyl-prolyl cis-trans isomerase B (cyclophilin B)
MPRLIVLLIASLLLLSACGGDDDAADEEAGAAERTATAAPAEEVGCEEVEAPEPKGGQDLRRPQRRLDADTTYVAEVTTSCGTFEITLDAERAPKTGGSFAHLAREGFFDGLTFHRIVPGFVIQGGDPRGDGTGGPGYRFQDEFSSAWRHETGVISMANAGPNTNGSQFFITLAPAPHLDGAHSVFGRVTEGMDVVRSLRQGDVHERVDIEER